MCDVIAQSLMNRVYLYYLFVSITNILFCFILFSLGSGKTAAFLVPVLSSIFCNGPYKESVVSFIEYSLKLDVIVEKVLSNSFRVPFAIVLIVGNFFPALILRTVSSSYILSFPFLFHIFNLFFVYIIVVDFPPI